MTRKQLGVKGGVDLLLERIGKYSKKADASIKLAEESIRALTNRLE